MTNKYPVRVYQNNIIVDTIKMKLGEAYTVKYKGATYCFIKKQNDIVEMFEVSEEYV